MGKYQINSGFTCQSLPVTNEGGGAGGYIFTIQNPTHVLCKQKYRIFKAVKTFCIVIWLNTCNNYLIHLHFSLPWLLSLWVSAFLFLPLEGSDCFFSGVYKQQKEHDPTSDYLFILLLHYYEINLNPHS